ncbi:hypothetical protein [Mesorhizobium sp. M0895]|uniref:hypothetical protein n=1 Tax=Mesorhizobium sp. M0895 TaxID=2957019 RepID=UPI003339DEF3
MQIGAPPIPTRSCDIVGRFCSILGLFSRGSHLLGQILYLLQRVLAAFLGDLLQLAHRCHELSPPVGQFAGRGGVQIVAKGLRQHHDLVARGWLRSDRIPPPQRFKLLQQLELKFRPAVRTLRMIATRRK